MHFLFSSISVVYVLTTPIPEDGGDNATVEQIRKRNKWDNNDYIYRGLILKEAKYIVADASSKKFLVSNFTNYKMTNSRPVLDQYNELFGILGRFTQHKMNIDEAIQVSCIIDKLPHSWKNFKHTLKNNKEELTLVELGSHLRIEESLKAQDSDKPKGNNVAGPQTESRVLGAVVRLPDPKLKTLGERDIECIFVGYVKHSKAFRFSSIFRLSQRSLVNRTEDIGCSVVPEEITEKADLPPGLETKRKGLATFDTYALVARISTIRLLIAMKSIHNLTIHRMDVKTTILNGDLDEEVLNQPQGFIMPDNENKAISQLEYSRVIGCLMYVMTCTRPDIAFVVGNWSRYTSNPGTQHWQAIQRVLKYLKKTMDYRLTYTGYPSVLEGYTDASLINNTEDNSFTSGWVFLLGGSEIS
ncbi:zinc finger, CCHC-type containing protein [Tanacetum coccineum]|uniref:Zinc finger, CCHC-type containing protein n=1 Tax=Tanacetum coccineum TaxID=301880 RepID=A0ABQ5G8R9_9ASTR